MLKQSVASFYTIGDNSGQNPVIFKRRKCRAINNVFRKDLYNPVPTEEFAGVKEWRISCILSSPQEIGEAPPLKQMGRCKRR